MTLDPVESNPDHYALVRENDRVRVLEYTDWRTPGGERLSREIRSSVPGAVAQVG